MRIGVNYNCKRKTKVPVEFVTGCFVFTQRNPYGNPGSSVDEMPVKNRTSEAGDRVPTCESRDENIAVRLRG